MSEIDNKIEQILANYFHERYVEQPDMAKEATAAIKALITTEVEAFGERLKNKRRWATITVQPDEKLWEYPDKEAVAISDIDTALSQYREGR